jgi:hypothetical protein
MQNRDLRDAISDLEERVEGLAESLVRCRKIMLASKVSMMFGGLWMLAILLGLLTFDPLAMIVAFTAIIGGIVVFGSTATTAKQTSSAMKDAEALRIELISRLELQMAEES